MNSQHDRTFRIDKLYHQFLKPKGGGIEDLPILVQALELAGMIVQFVGPAGDERYFETEKMKSRDHRNELFKTVQKVLNK